MTGKPTYLKSYEVGNSDFILSYKAIGCNLVYLLDGGE